MVRKSSRSEILNVVFGAIADPTRRSILDRLREGPLTVTELASPYSISLNAVSKHIKTLESAGLVRRTIRGRQHCCRLEAARFDEAMEWMRFHTDFWNARLEALDEHLIAKRRRGGR